MKKILYFFVAIYIIFFSIFSVARYRNMYANYFDLGIMHHVVYNSYQAMRTGDWSRFLEHTDPIGPQQVVRSAVHNDIILGLFAPLYFISPSPAILLVVQSVALGVGAIVLYGIAQHIMQRQRHRDRIALVCSVAYLFYPPLQLMNRFDFHAVALATPLILFMIYYWMQKRYGWSTLFLVLSLSTKEQVGLTTAVFGAWVILSNMQLTLRARRGIARASMMKLLRERDVRFGLMVLIVSVVWVALSFKVIIPFFRGGGHFALSRYEQINVMSMLYRQSTVDYLRSLFGPLGFSSFLSPFWLIALPEFCVNLLSQDPNMHSIVFHYTAVLIPFIFISSLYALRYLMNVGKYAVTIALWIIVVCTLWFSVSMSPLPYSKQRDLYVFYPQKNARDAREWAYRLRDDSIPVAATGNVGTFMSSRRRFYYFSQYYPRADYVIIRPSEVFTYHDKETLIPVYRQLIRDPRYVLVDKRDNFEVYKKI